MEPGPARIGRKMRRKFSEKKEKKHYCCSKWYLDAMRSLHAGWLVQHAISLRRITLF